MVHQDHHFTCVVVDALHGTPGPSLQWDNLRVFCLLLQVQACLPILQPQMWRQKRQALLHLLLCKLSINKRRGEIGAQWYTNGHAYIHIDTHTSWRMDKAIWRKPHYHVHSSAGYPAHCRRISNGWKNSFAFCNGRIKPKKNLFQHLSQMISSIARLLKILSPRPR